MTINKKNNNYIILKIYLSMTMSEKINDYCNLSKIELLAKCNELGIKKYKSKRKTELVNLIKCNKPEIIRKKKNCFIICWLRRIRLRIY